MTAPSDRRLRRSDRIQSALAKSAGVCWRLLVIAAALWLVGYLLGKIWYVVLPVVLAIFVTTLLWPATRFLRAHRWPPAVASIAVVLAFLVLLLAAGAVIVGPVAAQAEEVTDGVSGGIESVQEWVAGPPFNLGDDQVGAALDEGLARLRESAGDIVSIVFGGITAVGNALIALVLILTLVFFYLKDGPRFLPWLERQTGSRSAPHVAELGRRYYQSLASFMHTQLIVGLIDAVFIGIGLLLIGVPLVLPLAVLTFIGAFIPIIGAFVAGGVAVLVALVSEGFTAALIVLAIIVVVQQLEGNVFAPILQGRSLKLHAVVVILAVIAGGSLAGVTGAFLAVPVAALIAITWRYVRTQLDDTAAEDEALGQTTKASGTTSSSSSKTGTGTRAGADRPGKAATGAAPVPRPGRPPKSP
ncbi:MAG: AI-2E family transporter [Actinomycetota bacterium]|nr:AI-2E family transporter [Actinomycetota bacterium]